MHPEKAEELFHHLITLGMVILVQKDKLIFRKFFPWEVCRQSFPRVTIRWGAGRELFKVFHMDTQKPF
ncbi:MULTISPECIES: hypothetical protein [Akkermansia]|nr:hypothetical protein [Candidatus Akkermansia timonensis]MBS7153430.1 hypothetical protein [Akkermansia sp.]QWO95973.1 hypothetical protein J5W49_13275 [Candidatus Akkermansia timonensis]